MSKIKRVMVGIYMFFCRVIFGIDKTMVLFVSFQGKSYSDNPKALSEALHKLCPELKIVWAFKEPETKKEIVPTYVKTIKINKLLVYYRYLACCKMFVNNFNLPIVPKSKKQIFVQTWHGDKAIKRVLYESDHIPKNYKIADEIPGFCDYAVAGSDRGEMQYRKAFRYKGTILKFGSPRNDRLVQRDKSEIIAIKNKLKLEEGAKYILYAPTLRRKYTSQRVKQEVNNINLSKLLNTLEAQYQCNCRCLLRAHPALGGIVKREKDDRIYDVSAYEDMTDLLLVSDILITDYSSSAGDFALLERPVVLYQEDLNDYLNEDRKLCFDINKGPFMVAKNQKELEDLLVHMNGKKIQENCNKISEFYGNRETGQASEQIVKILLKKIKQ